MKNITILGSTGSIGKNVLNVIRSFPGRFRVVGLAAGKNINLLREQAEAFQPLFISVSEEESAEKLKQMMAPEWHDRIVHGRYGVEQVATIASADTVVSAIVGAAGLPPTYAAIKAGKDIALANKETLVMAGNLIIDAVERYKVNLLPVDSEHNAIFQALAAGRHQDVNRILLTASGGPLRNIPENQLWDVSPNQALAHPNWDMGKKISIDSASLMNKGLEVIEAKWLFGVELDKIEVLIHPQSIVHSMVEFIDGSIIAQMGVPDMRVPIAYALTYPERIRVGLPPLNLLKQGVLTFLAPDFGKFPALTLAYKACKLGGIAPAVLNAANEVAVESFLDCKIRFPEIALTVAETINRTKKRKADSIETILDADLNARVLAESVVDALMLSGAQRKGEPLPIVEIPPENDYYTLQTNEQ